MAVPQVDTHADIVATVLEFDAGDTESVAGSVPDISSEVDSPVEDEVTQSPALVFGAGVRAALQELDEEELEAEFITRACMMKFPLVFLRGKYWSAMSFALQEAQRVREQRDEVGSTRAWKLFLLLPRLLLHRPPRGGLIPKCQLQERITDFAAGRWAHLLEQSRRCAEQVAVASRRRRRRRGEDNIQRRADRAEALVQMGELSAGRHALEGAALAPGSEATLNELQNPVKRPPEPREPLPDDLFVRRGPLFELDFDLFSKNLRVSRRGAASGPSGMTAEHLRPLLESEKDMTLFWQLAQDLARAAVPDVIVDSVRLGRITALQKPNGGVRGIIAGDMIRRLVARTMSQQLSKAVERATSPFQYALTTPSGGECIAHALQAITDLDDRATVLSIDGIGAFDLISRCDARWFAVCRWW